VEIVQGVIANGPRGFGRDPAISIVRIDPVSDLQLFHAVDDLDEEPAITDNAAVIAKYDRELGRQAVAVSRADFVQKGRRLLACENTERKSHEIFVRHKLRHSIQIPFGEKAEE
jgi:hypothetical protein